MEREAKASLTEFDIVKWRSTGERRVGVDGIECLGFELRYRITVQHFTRHDDNSRRRLSTERCRRLLVLALNCHRLQHKHNPLTPTVAIQHPVPPDRVKPSFVIFDIRALWLSALSVTWTVAWLVLSPRFLYSSVNVHCDVWCSEMSRK